MTALADPMSQSAGLFWAAVGWAVTPDWAVLIFLAVVLFVIGVLARWVW